MKPDRLAALALLMLAPGAHAQNTIVQGTSTLFQGSTNRGTFATHDACREAARTRAISTQTNYQCREALAVTPPTPSPPPPSPPTVSLQASPGTVASGSTSTLAWSSTNATGCTAGGSWSGAKGTAGSEQTVPLTATSTFSLTCSGPAGSANASATVNISAAGSMTGLDFPSNSGDYIDYSFRFTGSALLPMQPATYVWNVMPRQQSGYYTTFFWGFSDSFTGSNEYYGAHPYPDNPPSGSTHKWEISTNGFDYTTDVNGNNTSLQYGRWYTQALVVTPSGSNSLLTFYWDLPNTSKRIVVTVHGGLRPPSNPTLAFGAAPWAVFQERLSGILRGIRLYSASLSQVDVLSEANTPLSTSAGAASIWYMNMNPSPNDISDKSGRGHHPTWAGSGRPALWSQ
jgi:hypothetical protein